MSDGEFLVTTGEGYDDLISDLVEILSDHTDDHEPKMIVCVALAIVCDFARINFGDEALVWMSTIVAQRKNYPPSISIEGAK